MEDPTMVSQSFVLAISIFISSSFPPNLCQVVASQSWSWLNSKVVEMERTGKHFGPHWPAFNFCFSHSWPGRGTSTHDPFGRARARAWPAWAALLVLGGDPQGRVGKEAREIEATMTKNHAGEGWQRSMQGAPPERWEEIAAACPFAAPCCCCCRELFLPSEPAQPVRPCPFRREDAARQACVGMYIRRQADKQAGRQAGRQARQGYARWTACARPHRQIRRQEMYRGGKEEKGGSGSCPSR